MKIKKNKKLKDIFLGSVLLQIIFILAYSANFLLAETLPMTDPDFTITITSSENSNGIITTNASGVSLDNQFLSELSFYFDDPATTNNLADYVFPGVKTDEINWQTTIDASLWNNGEYTLYAKGIYNEYTFDTTPYISNTTSILINNPLQIISFTSPTGILSGTDQHFWILLNQEANVNFQIIESSSNLIKELNGIYYGLYSGYHKYYIHLDTTTIPNGEYIIKAIATNATEETINEKVINIENATTNEPETTIQFLNPPTSPLSGNQIIYIQTNNAINLPLFKIFPGIGGAAYTPYPSTLVSNYTDKYQFTWPTTDFINGIYSVKAIVNINNDNTTDVSINNIEIKNIIISEPTINFSDYYKNTIQTFSETTEITTVSTGEIDINLLTFKTKKISVSSNEEYIEYNALKNTTTNEYYFNLDTTELTHDSEYYIKVFYKNILSDSFTAKIDNVPVPPVKFINFPTSPLAKTQTIYVEIVDTTAIVKFIISPLVTTGIIKEITGTRQATSTNTYYFIWNTRDFDNGLYKVSAIAKNSNETILGSSTVDNIKIYNIETENSVLDFISTPTSLTLLENKFIYIELNQLVDSVKFDISGPVSRSFDGTNEKNTKKYYFFWNIDNLPNGEYQVKITAKKGDILKNKSFSVIARKNIPEIIDDNNLDDIVIAPNPKIIIDTDSNETDADADAISNPEIIDKNDLYNIINYQTQKELLCENAGIENLTECNIYLFNLHAVEECKNQGFENNKQCTDYIFLKSAPVICTENNITTRNECNEKIETTNETIKKNSYEYEACTKEGITDIEECNYRLRKNYIDFKTTIKLNRENNLPTECKEQNLLNANECESFMFREHAPEECKINNINTINECDKLVFKNISPRDCKIAKITDFESCNEFIFEKYNKEYEILSDQMPIECRIENITSNDDCKKIIRTIYLPKQCTINGIQVIEECALLLNKKNLIEECQYNNITTKDDCNEFMFNESGLQECEKNGVYEYDECKYYIFNKYISKINCTNIGNWNCKNIIAERYLGDIVYKQTIFEKIEDNKDKLRNRSLPIETLKEEVKIPDDIIPLRETKTNIKIIGSSNNLMGKGLIFHSGIE